MPYGMPAGVAAFGAGLAGGNTFNNVFGTTAASGGGDDSFKQVAQVLQLENALSSTRMQKQRLAMQQQAAADEAAEAKRQQTADQALLQRVPQDLRDVAAGNPDILRRRLIEQALPDAPSASERYRVVGNQLYDISGEAPQLAATSPRAPGRPMPVLGDDGQVRYVPADQAVGMTPPPRNGVTVSPDGTVQIGGAATPLGKRAQGELETSLIDLGQRRDRIDQIVASFDPRYLQIGERLGQAVSTWADKFGQLDAAGQQSLADFTNFKQTSFNELTQTLKEMSGAAVTPQEAERQLLVLPNPGKGIFDGDSPVQFKAKMEGAAMFVRRAQARLNYIRTRGLDAGDDFAGIKLDDIPRMADARGREIESGLRKTQPGLTDAVYSQMAQQQVMREFGF